MGASQDATRLTSIWCVKQKNSYGTKNNDFKMTKASAWRALNAFYWKPFTFTLTAYKRENHVWSISYLVPEDQLIKFKPKPMKNTCN